MASADDLNIAGFILAAFGSALAMAGAFRQAQSYNPLKVTEYPCHVARVVWTYVIRGKGAALRKLKIAVLVTNAAAQASGSPTGEDAAAHEDDVGDDLVESLLGLHLLFVGFILQLFGALLLLAAALSSTAVTPSGNMQIQITEINSALSNLDDYKLEGTATVNFKFDSAELELDATRALDKFVQAHIGKSRRYFLAISGFTDTVGTDKYNLALGRRRAEAVQTYMVGQCSVPIFRVQVVSFGKDKPVDEDNSEDARAKNRRVEVTYYNADARSPSPASVQAPANR
jgi:outer membrane protein OmpA-like peptidoglycan-associated protein